MKQEVEQNQVVTRPRGAYGLWAAEVVTAEGGRVTGFGHGEQNARLNALAKARLLSAEPQEQSYR
jgi:hypothetical protein